MPPPSRSSSQSPTRNFLVLVRWNSRLRGPILFLLAVFLILLGLHIGGEGGDGEDIYGRMWNPIVVVKTAFARPPLATPSIAFDSRPNPLAAIDDALQAPYEVDELEDEFGEAVTPRLEEHTFLPNGLLVVNPRGRHPIYDLTEGAEQAWAAKLERQSKTLEQAVQEYHRRYQRHPPHGFDKWWDYVLQNNVQLPDEYDQIMTDFAPFFAYSPRSVRTLQAELRDQPGTYTLASSPSTGRLTLEKANFQSDAEFSLGMERARAQLETMRGYDEREEEHGEGVERELVELTGEWEATFSAHDGPQDFFDWDFYQEMMEKIDVGEYMPLSEHAEMYPQGWAGACPPLSPLRQSFPSPPSLPLPSPDPKTFIHDHRLSMSPCLHPELVHTVGFLSGHGGTGPGPQERRKFVFGMCKSEGLHGDLLSVPTEHWRPVGEVVPWKDKTDDRMIWRGSTTGIRHDPHTPWRASQRIRLITKLNENTGNRSVLPPSSASTAVGDPIEIKAAWLNPILADVGFVNEPIQCHDGACEEMEEMFDWRGPVPFEKMFEYKYLMDIDGNGWSARFKRLMSANSLVLKVTVFPEWYMDRVQPWVHYVPIKMDLTDLYDVLTFFRGDVSRGGAGGHDELAEKIAAQGTEWSRTFWRREDMIAYTYRQFLEYARLVSDDRDNLNYKLPEFAEP